MPTTRDDVEVPGYHSNGEVSMTIFGDEIRQALNMVDFEYLVKAGSPEIRIDQKNFELGTPGQGRREVECRRRGPIAVGSPDKENRLG